MLSKFNNRKKGFTLIELLIVIVIVGILMALAIPRFMSATTKAKQTEAKTILNAIYKMEIAYRCEKDTYTSDFNTLGISIAPNTRYTYSIVSDSISFRATAEGQLDDDATLDKWTIDEMGDLVCEINDVSY